jgi:magnesium-transporting ATPase (P-type)
VGFEEATANTEIESNAKTNTRHKGKKTRLCFNMRNLLGLLNIIAIISGWGGKKND